MVVPAALSAERLPAPSTRAPRGSMALSLVLHGAAVLLLLAAGAAGSSTTNEAALIVELAFAAVTAETNESSTDAAPPASEAMPEPPVKPAPPHEMTVELAPPEEPPPPDLTPPKQVELTPSQEPPPIDLSELKPIELAPSQEPPPIAAAELKPVAPPKAPPPPSRPPQARPATTQTVAAKAPPSHNFGGASEARQAAAGFLPTPAIVFEGKPRYRHPPTPAVYPSRAVDLNQQGEVLVRVRLDHDGAAVEIVLHRSSGHPLLDQSALAAVRGWHFLPAMRDGRAVASWVEIPVRFHLR